MDIYEVRLINARVIAKEIGGNKPLAIKMGKEESRISQIIGKNPSKNIGAKTAREIDAAGDKEPGWLDLFHGDPTIPVRSSDIESVDDLTPEEKIEVEQFKDFVRSRRSNK